MGDPSRVLFGLVPPPAFDAAESRVNTVLRGVSEQAGVSVMRRHVESYDHLAGRLRAGELDVAWLPPILFARLVADGIVHELVSAERAGRDTYTSVLIARADAGISTRMDLAGKRVGWVDPLSATGYVVPRVRLAAAGFHPAKTFRSETFLGSHHAVARAVLDRGVEVGATFAGFGDAGEPVRGPFLELGPRSEEILIVDSFSTIPPDVIAVRPSVPEDVQERLAKAFEDAEGPTLDAIRRVFGVVRFVREPITGYDLLRTEVDQGVESGLIPAAAAFLSTRPPRA
jgi:phosphate/phosphite/phosphonate ABC transporter binding protein